MGIKLMPTMATLTNKKELVEKADGKIYMKVCVAIDGAFFWCVLFGGTATYIDEYANVGAQLFLEDWTMNKSESFYDFAILRTKIIRNGDDK
ncbi:MAG: hypothetical protein ACRCX7_11235 [Cetobacterium sp.]|uniref:hypothetical protein n=1 Tax=Cetobacterium sp. TaxID=2071632 RepID=UPI003F33A992